MKRKGCARYLLITLAALLGLLIVLIAVSALYNLAQPTHSQVVDRLSEADKIRLAEVNHLRRSLGDSVLPGWSQADIPLIVYNEQNIFLTGITDPPQGWSTVPRGNQHGEVWQVMQGDRFQDQTYYSQPITVSGVNTQAFTVRIGEAWAASLGTYEWMFISLADPLREDLPIFLRPIFPYRLVTRLMIPGSDAYASMILHEAAHAYQGIRAPERLAAAEQAGLESGDRYPWENEALIQDWRSELDILHQALRSASDAEVQQLARRFLDQRAERRAAARLSPSLVDYERQREWEEGIAKYAERKIYVLASDTSAYTPIPETRLDPEFHGYKNGPRRWDQEVDQLRRTASDPGDGRFYYTGFAQAVMLDRLSPGWKERLFDDGIFLEDLLAEALR